MPAPAVRGFAITPTVTLTFGLSTMRFLITGGYGFLGAWIARELLAQGAGVVAYDLREDPRRLLAILTPDEAKRVTFAQGDVTDLPGLTDALKRHAVTHVIHLAGLQVPTCRQYPLLGATVNVVGTLAVFEAVKAVAGQVGRVVYASSAAVFGPLEAYAAGSQADDARLLPSTHYGVFKICNEGNARVYHQDHAISSVGLRPWTVYGPGRDMGMTSEPTKAIKACLLGRPYAINLRRHDGLPIRPRRGECLHPERDAALQRRGGVQPARRGRDHDGVPRRAVRGAAGRGETGDDRHDADRHPPRLERRRADPRPRADAEDPARRGHPRHGRTLPPPARRGPARHQRHRRGRPGPGRDDRRGVTPAINDPAGTISTTVERLAGRCGQSAPRVRGGLTPRRSGNHGTSGSSPRNSHSQQASWPPHFGQPSTLQCT